MPRCLPRCLLFRTSSIDARRLPSELKERSRMCLFCLSFMLPSSQITRGGISLSQVLERNLSSGARAFLQISYEIDVRSPSKGTWYMLL